MIAVTFEAALAVIDEGDEEWRAADEFAEGSKRGHVLHCLSDLEGADLLPGYLPELNRFHKRVPEIPQGELVLEVLARRDLATLYAFAQSWAPAAYPREGGKNATAREQAAAASLYGDAYLALADWITAWNRRRIRVVA